MGIFNFLVRMGLDASSFEAGAKRAESTMAGVSNFAKTRLGPVLSGAFSVATVSKLMHDTVEYGDRIGDLADKFSLTNEEVQKLDIVAKKTGTEVEAMGQMFLRVGEYRKRAGEGDKDAVEMLSKMGVSLSDIQSRSLSNKDIAEKISGWYDKTSKTAKDQADLAEVAGVKSEKLLSVLSQIHSLGPVKLISDEDIKAISEFKDAMDESKRNLMVAAAPVAGFWGRVLGRANENESKSPDQLFNFTRALISEMTDDGSGASTKALTPEEIKAKREKMAEQSTDLYKNKAVFEKRADSSSLTGSPLRSIGGFFFDRFDEIQPVRQIVRWTEKTATAAEETAKSLKRLEGNQ